MKQSKRLSRREFIGASTAAAALLFSASCKSVTAKNSARAAGRLLFTTQGRTALIHADGTGLHFFDFKIPDQATWQPGPFFPDGQRLVFLSMEKRRDGPGKPFAEYYHKTPTRIWLYNLKKDSLEELVTRDRLAVFYTPALLVGEDKILVQVVRDQGGQIYLMNLDGTGAKEFTRLGEGLPYGLSLSPNRRRVAYHLASPKGYQIWTSDLEGSDRVLVAANPERLYFGPSWSPDGQWLLFQSCAFKADPGHDWSDLCIARPDGSEFTTLTEGQPMWFAATYGTPSNRGGGSNSPTWTCDGHILFPRRIAEAKVPWEFQPHRPDTDHFNRDYKPELSHGGVEICKMNIASRHTTQLTTSTPPVWDFRASESSDGRMIVFCRAETGNVPGICVADSNGENLTQLTRGLDGQGADHPRWVPQKV